MPRRAPSLQCLWWSNEDDASRIIVEMPNHSIEDPCVIAKILSHLEGRGGSLRVSDSLPWSTRAASGLLGS